MVTILGKRRLNYTRLIHTGLQNYAKSHTMIATYIYKHTNSHGHAPVQTLCKLHTD